MVEEAARAQTRERGHIAAALSSPGVVAVLLPSLLARLPFAALSLLLVLRTRELGASYAAAGLVVAAYAVASGVSEPWIARVADRRGQSPVLAVTIPLCGAGFVIAAQAGSVIVLGAGAALIGAAYPQVGGMARALLVRLLPEGPLRRAAFALETGAVEALFISAPAIFVAGIAAAAGAAAAIAIGGVIVVLAAAGFAVQPTSRAWRPALVTADGRLPLASRSYALLVAMLAALALSLGATEVALTAFAEARGSRSSVGLLLALSAAGSLAGGILLARARAPRSETRLLAGLIALQAIVTALLALPGSLLAMAFAITLSGATVSPTMATVFNLVSRIVPESRITEGFAWLGTGLMVGVAVGAALGGAIVDATSPGAVFLAACVPLLLAAAVVRVALDEPRPGPPAAHGDAPA